MNTVKQIIVILALSTAIVTAMTYAQQVVQWLLMAHDWVSMLLTEVFSGGPAGSMVRGLIALLAVPVLIALVPTIIYWLVRRHWFPYFSHIVWVIWLLQAGAILVYGTSL